MEKTVLLINGPNLNMLGIREKDKYGNITLQEIEEKCKTKAKNLNIRLKVFQSNSEGEIINYIHREGIDSNGIIINAGAYTHTSIAIRDALLSINKPFIEIHLSNIFAREPFRHISYLSDIAKGIICGFGEDSYYLALEAILKFI